MLSAKEKEMHLDQLLSNSPITETISLKIGTVVMCLCNLDMEHGIGNGSQGIVIGFELSSSVIELAPKVRFANGVVRVIERHAWQSDEYPALYITQYPLCLAWALTIHKIQGATLSMAEMDLGTTIFEYGQTYVALSRIKTLDGLYLSAFHPQRIKANPIVCAFYESIETATVHHRRARTPELGTSVGICESSGENVLSKNKEKEKESNVDWKQYEYSQIDPTVKRITTARPQLVIKDSNPTKKDPSIKVVRM
jgi:hypothetical protein